MRPLLAPNLGGFSMKQASVSLADQGGEATGFGHEATIAEKATLKPHQGLASAGIGLADRIGHRID